MLFLSVALFAITLLVCVVQAAAFRRLYRYVERELVRDSFAYFPKASVILPCKGIDPGFRENVEKLLSQDYPDFEVLFAVADEHDPAYPVLAELAGSAPVPCRTVVAGYDPRRAQKINNQLAALGQIRPESEVLVFVDSDVIAREDFLRRLVDPLAQSEVGVTTGYRFYVAPLHNCFAILRSLWNRMSAWEMAHPRFAFAWGGAMAVRLETFRGAAVEESWSQAADDDLSLTTSIKRLGLKVHFVPQCLVASDGDGSFAEIFEWTNRQLILTKVYYRELWMRAVVRAVVMLTWLVFMSVSVAALAFSREPGCVLAVAAGSLILPVEVFFLLKARRLWQRVLSDRADYLNESLATSCLAIPLAHVVLPFLTLFSVLTNRITWRGVSYELRSPTETLVIS